MTVVDLDMARVEREEDNKKVSVEELLRFALKTVREEKRKPKAAFVCVILEEDDGRLSLDGFRCQVSRAEEIGYLESYKQQQIRKWME